MWQYHMPSENEMWCNLHSLANNCVIYSVISYLEGIDSHTTFCDICHLIPFFKKDWRSHIIHNIKSIIDMVSFSLGSKLTRWRKFLGIRFFLLSIFNHITNANEKLKTKVCFTKQIQFLCQNCFNLKKRQFKGNRQLCLIAVINRLKKYPQTLSFFSYAMKQHVSKLSNIIDYIFNFAQASF